MQQYDTVKKRANDILNNVCQNKVMRADKYKGEWLNFLALPEEIADMSDEHSGRAIAAKDRLKLIEIDVRSVYSALHKTGLTERKFAPIEINRML